MKIPRLVPLIAAAALTLSGCGAIPADDVGTFDRASGGTLVVGVSENQPYTNVDDRTGEVSGSEADLISGFAEQIDAEVQWRPGAESELAQSIQAGDLDVIVGGLQSSSPWTSHMAMTRPYTDQTVMGIRMGENELMTELETYLAEETGEI